MITICKIGVEKGMIEGRQRLPVQTLFCFNYHADAPRQFTANLRNMIFPWQFWVNNNTKKFCFIYLLDLFVIYLYIYWKGLFFPVKCDMVCLFYIQGYFIYF